MSENIQIDPQSHYADQNSVDDAVNDSDDDARDRSYVLRQRTMHFTSSSSIPSSSSSSFFKTKRNYKHATRVVRHKTMSNRRKQWDSILSQTDDQIRTMVCCSTRNCFQTVNLRRLRQTMATLLTLSRSTRRISLAHMYTSAGTFCFDGKHVCTKFLTDAFRFSSDLQTSTRMSISASPSTSAQISQQQNGEALDSSGIIEEGHMINHDWNESLADISDELTAFRGYDTSADYLVQFNNSIKKDAIITFLTRISNATADLMPDSKERHLPFVNKLAVFHRFKTDFRNLYPCTSCPTPAYFYSVWRSECPDIKVRKVTRVTKCGTCESLRSEILKATSRILNTDELLAQKSAHLMFVDTERREYKSKVELSKLRPREYMSIVV